MDSTYRATIRSYSIKGSRSGTMPTLLSMMGWLGLLSATFPNSWTKSKIVMVTKISIKSLRSSLIWLGRKPIEETTNLLLQTRDREADIQNNPTKRKTIKIQIREIRAKMEIIPNELSGKFTGVVKKDMR